MRRFLGLLLVTALIIPAVAVSAASSHGEYRDDFKAISYSGNDGSLTWSGSWYDSEDQDPQGGVVHVADDGQCQVNKCLHIDSDGIQIEIPEQGIYIKRQADLSVFAAAEWCFDMVIAGVLPLTDAILWVEVSPNGTNWTVLDQFPILTSAGYRHLRYDMSDHLDEGTYVRYRVSGLLGAEIYIDNVEVKGELEGGGGSSTTSSTSTSTSSTTSTTQPTTTTSQPATTTTISVAETTTTTPATTSTTEVEETTTTSIVTAGGPPPPRVPPSDSGIRDTRSGLIADYEGGMMGDMGMEEVEVLGAELTADFSLAVEAFESAKVWIAVLALMIAAAIISGMDSRRSRRQQS